MQTIYNLIENLLLIVILSINSLEAYYYESSIVNK